MRCLIICDMDCSVKQLAVLGSTGSIGKQTLEIVRAMPHRFRIVGLAVGKNTNLLVKQISEFKPRFVYCQAKKAQARLDSKEYEILSLEDIARHPQVDIVVIATAGKSGISSTLAAVKAGKKVALANKESLVMAGELITGEAKLNGAQILPIDSEHSAIWQCLRGERQKIAQLILTASGGPFHHYSPAQLNGVTTKQALKHQKYSARSWSKRISSSEPSASLRRPQETPSDFLRTQPHLFKRRPLPISPASISLSKKETCRWNSGSSAYPKKNSHCYSRERNS